MASLRAAMLAAAQGGVSQCGCRHEDELRGSEESACASTPTEPKCIKWHTRYKWFIALKKRILKYSLSNINVPESEINKAFTI